MKILICYGKHPYTTGEFIEKSLRKYFSCFSLGTVSKGSYHDYIVENPYCDIVDEIKKIKFKPDIALFIESGVEFFPVNIDKLDIPTIYYSIDSHFNYNWQKNYFTLFDNGFITFKQFTPKVTEFINWSPKYLPHGYDNDIYYYNNEQKKYNISFVGDISKNRIERINLLNKLKNFDIKLFNNVWGENVRKLYAQSRLVFNENAFGVLNPRNFEASACKSLVLSNNAIGLDEYFQDNKNIIIYNDVNDIANKAGNILNNNRQLQQLTEKSWDTAKQNSWDNRIISVQEEFNSFTKKIKKNNIVLNYGLLFFKRKIYSKALEYFKQLLKIEPQNYLPYLYISKIFLNIGDNQKAKEFLNYAKQFKSDNEIFFLENLILLQTNFNKAFFNLIELNNVYQKYDLKYLLSILYINSNKLEEAKKLLTEAINLDPYRFEAKEKLKEIFTSNT